MRVSLRIRLRRTVVGGAVLAVALGGLAAAQPAQASAGKSATSAPTGIGASGRHASGLAQSLTSQSQISDSLNPGGVTAPDAILTCATSQIAIGGTEAVAVPVGCLTEYNGEWVKVTWPAGVSTELTQQTDGNLVVETGTGLTWSAGTTFKANPEGPGCLAQFQSSADLVVNNCAGTSIWNSGAHAYPDAVLAFQADGNVVIYETSAGTALWSSATNAAAATVTPDVSQTQVRADFNGDGRSDIAYLYNQTAEGADDTSVWVQTANTTGGFNPPTKVWDSGVGNFDWDDATVLAGDFNGDGDGDCDIAVLYNQTAEGTDDISLYLLDGTGAGTFNTTNGNVPNKVWDSGTGEYDWNHIQLG